MFPISLTNWSLHFINLLLTQFNVKILSFAHFRFCSSYYNVFVPFYYLLSNLLLVGALLSYNRRNEIFEKFLSSSTVMDNTKRRYII